MFNSLLKVVTFACFASGSIDVTNKMRFLNHNLSMNTIMTRYQ